MRWRAVFDGFCLVLEKNFARVPAQNRNALTPWQFLPARPGPCAQGIGSRLVGAPAGSSSKCGSALFTDRQKASRAGRISAEIFFSGLLKKRKSGWRRQRKLKQKAPWRIAAGAAKGKRQEDRHNEQRAAQEAIVCARSSEHSELQDVVSC